MSTLWLSGTLQLFGLLIDSSLIGLLNLIVAQVTLKFTRREIDDAGRALVRWGQLSDDEKERVFDVFDNWRAVHAHPLNVFTRGLAKRSAQLNQEAIVAQRLKRIVSIYVKLVNRDWLTLSKVQDIGGCRSILGSVRTVYRLVEVYKRSSIKHKLIKINDYIANPKPDGYRSIHLIYEYFSDRVSTYNGLKIEIQLRTNFQHAWATAVETVDVFTNQGLKTGTGESKWRRFFALMSGFIAYLEGSPPVPGVPVFGRGLKNELRHSAQELDVVTKLSTYSISLRAVEDDTSTFREEDAHYFLIERRKEPEFPEGRVYIASFKYSQFPLAQKAYSDREKQARDVVLVSMENLSRVHEAFPNYYNDISRFTQLVHEAIR